MQFTCQQLDVRCRRENNSVMMYYIESGSVSPRFNLALEQYIFDCLPREHEYFMLWQNENAVIIGRHQNTASEIQEEFVKKHGIQVVRRLSGGGAVYHDLGNLNYTFIVDQQSNKMPHFEAFLIPVVNMLKSIGVVAQVNGRNDITIEGRKFSGNAQYVKDGRIMHHGTILYDSDLQMMNQALHVSEEKERSKGVPSIRSRVTNVRPYVPNSISMEEFMRAFCAFMMKAFNMQEYCLTDKDIEKVRNIQHRIYDRQDWNYDRLPTYNKHNKRYIDGCGMIEVFIYVKDGFLENLHFCGDYFSESGTACLAERLKGCRMEEKEIWMRLQGVDIERCFKGAERKDILHVLM